MDHETRSRVADRGGALLQAVLFDLLGTIVTPIPSFGAALACIYFEVAGVQVTPTKALRVTTEEHWGMKHRTNDPVRDWIRINRRILARLRGVRVGGIPISLAAQVRPKVISLKEHRYEVRDAVHRLLRRLSHRLPLGIASTVPWGVGQGWLDTFRLRNYFRPDWLFFADRIGGRGDYVDKPSARFWALVRTQTKVRNARAVALVGDTLRSDGLAVQHGHPVVLLDPCGHQVPFAPRHQLLVICHSTRQVEAALRRFGLPR